ncbi:Mov34/MPN/PAD-1 family protein [Elizabethkingia anophelis]|uniref:Mov34/MPN/PAD-1 family protein n=1 Tax=Elizabethkingia anophelis TaxID=1117645 RepID=UPI003892524A
MKLINPVNKLELVIDDGLLEKIGKIGVKHYPNEFGGFLIGKYSKDLKTLYITDYLLPKKYKGYPTVFQRSIDGLPTAFQDIFKTKNEYYIGEWHTHPNGSTMYSQTDLQAMIATSECETVQIKNPILLIFSINQKEVNNYTFYFYADNNLTAYEQKNT